MHGSVILEFIYCIKEKFLIMEATKLHCLRIWCKLTTSVKYIYILLAIAYHIVVDCCRIMKAMQAVILWEIQK